MRCADGRWVYARRFVLFCTRFVYLISCRDPRPPRQRPSRPNTKRPTVRRFKTLLCCVLEPAASSQQPATTSQQRLPRSAPATPTVVTPQRPAADVRRPYVASLRPDDTRTGSDRAGVGARCRDVFYFGTRFVNRIGCRDPRPQRQRPFTHSVTLAATTWAVRRFPVHTGYPIRLPRRRRPSDFTS